MKATNYPGVHCCEHGDHPAPDGKRFCSDACKRCEGMNADFSIGCAGICHGRHDERLASHRRSDTDG